MKTAIRWPTCRSRSARPRRSPIRRAISRSPASPANPGPISAGGSVGTAQGRLDLTAPVAQLWAMTFTADANNAIPSPLILPMINWSTATSFSQRPPRRRSTITNPAMPGLGIQVPASSAARAPVSGTVSVAQVSAAARGPAHAGRDQRPDDSAPIDRVGPEPAGPTDAAEHRGIASRARSSTSI